MLAFGPTLVAFIVLAWESQVVLSRFNSIDFSTVQQCGSFHVKFSGGKLPSALPLALTVVPFNSTPISIEIPNPNWDAATETGAMVTFLPFAAETQFIASLDDATGASTGLVSEVVTIQPSSNTTCLGPASSSPTSRFGMQGTLAQCEPFKVSFDSTATSAAPAIRAFIPSNVSFTVPLESADANAGFATYTMDAPHDQQVVLLFSNNSTGIRETTNLLPVSGDASSNSACLPALNPPVSSSTSEAVQKSPGGLSRAAILAIGIVSGTIVGGIALSMAIWLYRVRRKLERSTLQNMEAATDADPDSAGWVGKGFDLVTKPLPAIMPPASQRVSITKTPSQTAEDTSNDDRYLSVKNPPYANAKFGLISPITSQFGRSPPTLPAAGRGTPSPIPIPLTTPVLTLDTGAKHGSNRSPPSSVVIEPDSPRLRPSSLSSDVIEQILEMATIYSPAVRMDTRAPPAAARRSSADIKSSTRADTKSDETPAATVSSPSRMPATRTGVATNAYPSPSLSGPVQRPSPAGSSTLYSPTSRLYSPTSRLDYSMRSPSIVAYRGPPHAQLPSTPLHSPGANSVFRDSFMPNMSDGDSDS